MNEAMGQGAFFIWLAVWIGLVSVGLFGLALDRPAMIRWGIGGGGLVLAIGAVGGLLVLGVCVAVGVEGRPISGPVIAKTHREESVTHTVIMVNNAPVPQTYHHPESWELTVEGDDWQKTFGVSKGEYERYQIGHRYP